MAPGVLTQSEALGLVQLLETLLLFVPGLDLGSPRRLLKDPEATLLEGELLIDVEGFEQRLNLAPGLQVLDLISSKEDPQFFFERLERGDFEDLRFTI